MAAQGTLPQVTGLEAATGIEPVYRALQAPRFTVSLRRSEAVAGRASYTLRTRWSAWRRARQARQEGYQRRKDEAGRGDPASNRHRMGQRKDGKRK